MHDSRRCTAKSKRSQERCKRAAIIGGTVCSMHGGKSPAVAARAAARSALATYGAPLALDPLDALLGELHRTAGHVAWLGQQVAQLNDAMVPTMFGLQPSGWIDLYRRERAHLARVSADCLKAGVEERRVRLAEAQGELVADLLRRVITSLGLDPASEEVRTVVRRELLQLVP